MSGDVLVFCETRNGVFRSFCGELLTQFRPIAEQEHVTLGAVVVGEVPGWESQLSAWGADTVYRLEPIPPEVGPEALADQLTNLVQAMEASFLLFGNTPLARTVAPRVSEQTAGAFMADCTGLAFGDKGPIFRRPVFGGKLVADVAAPREAVTVATFRPNALGVREVAVSTPILHTIDAAPDGDIRSKVVETVVHAAERVSLQEAETIVAGGRGLSAASGFSVIEDLAEALGGAVGASRVAVDSGWISLEHQVGQTGKAVSPNLYIACGISGAVQHFAGMGSARVIVAINKDPNCPMCEKADYTIVGDLYEVAPALAEEIRRIRVEG